MGERLGLRRLVRRFRGEHYEVEEERYDDLRDADGMLDLTAYADLALRQREAAAYIDLATSILDLDEADAPSWPAA